MNWSEQSVLVTGGTGSFGKKFVEIMLREYHPKRLVIFSRDELKQHDMRASGMDHPSLRYFLGDVRDVGRLERALAGVTVVVHAAALKQVPACEYNPFEAIQTNIMGGRNVIDAAINQGVRRVLALSTDKAVNPDQSVRRDEAVRRENVCAGECLCRGGWIAIQLCALWERRGQPRQRNSGFSGAETQRPHHADRSADDPILVDARAGRALRGQQHRANAWRRNLRAEDSEYAHGRSGGDDCPGMRDRDHWNPSGREASRSSGFGRRGAKYSRSRRPLHHSAVASMVAPRKLDQRHASAGRISVFQRYERSLADESRTSGIDLTSNAPKNQFRREFPHKRLS